MKQIQSPYPYFFDNAGLALDAGKIYIGTVNTNAETNQIAVYWDEAGTQPAAQPLRASGGYIVNGVTRSRVYVNADDFSMVIKDSKNQVVATCLSVESPATLKDELSDKTSALYGAGMIGHGATLNYAAGTIGAALNDVCINVKMFPWLAKGDGLEDDTAAIQAACTAAAGKRLYFPSGTYNTTGSITLPSNIAIEGNGDSSKIVVTGTGTNNIFNGTNITNVSIRKIWFYGNNQSDASGNGLCLYINQTAGAAAAGKNFVVEDCRLDNFKGDYWLYFVNSHTTHEMQEIFVRRNRFTSYSGNARNGATPAVPSACVSVQGSTAGAVARNIYIQDNVADCQYIKTFSILWQGCRGAVVSRNTVRNAGTDASISNDAGAYAFAIYDSSSLNVPRDFLYDGNIVDGVRSCGIYAAAAVKVRFTNNKINNQTDTVTTTLPKGGIVLNSCTDFIISGNEVRDCATFGIYWQPNGAASGEAGISIVNNKVDNCLTGVGLVSYLQDSSGVVVDSNKIHACTNGVQLQTIGSAVIDRLSITNNKITSVVSSSNGVRLRSDDALYSCKNVTIFGNVIQVAGYSIYWPLVTVGAVDISSNRIIGPVATRGIEFNGCTSATVNNNRFYGFYSGGECFRTVNARGVMAGNTFQNCSTSRILSISGANDMGRNAPSWTPTGQGEFIQTLTSTEAGSAGSKYVLNGWYYTGSAWVEQRMLTGN